jgi:hypothetical protein
MRKFLYISPFFPPIRRVGALAPLKIVRHLPNHGWSPIILADQSPSLPIDAELGKLVPEDVIIKRTYSDRQFLSPGQQSALKSAPATDGQISSYIDKFAEGRDLSPLGDYHNWRNIAFKEACKLVEQYKPDLIVAQSTPVAALLVGQRIAKKFDLPLVSIFADPWRPCELRNKRRLPHTRLVNYWREKAVIEASSRVILYTPRCRDDYIRLYPAMPESKFVSFHNGYDPDLQHLAPTDETYKNSMLFFGTFGSTVKARHLIELLANAIARGGASSRIRLILTMELPAQDRLLAEELQVSDRIIIMDHQHYRHAQSVFSRVSMLVAINPTEQRIAAKTYDYIASGKPILSLGPPHKALSEMFDIVGSAKHLAYDDFEGAVDFLDAAIEGTMPERPSDKSRPFSFAMQAPIIAKAFDDAAR